MASVVGICNRALQKLGAKRINDLDEGTPNARSCSQVYESVRDEELEKHTWSCAMARASLPVLASSPLFGKTNSFQLPSDFIRLLPPDPEYNYNTHDWQIEQNKIYTNDSAPLNVRYIFRLEDPNVMTPIFRELIATKMALEMCIEIAQSNVKKSELKDDYRQILREARRVNAIQRISQFPPTDEWITVRH